MKTIRIGSVEVPLVDYAVGASAILGIRDSGKTVTSKGIAEQLLDHDVPIIVFDAVGKWRWMKVASEAARGKAYKIVVAGGRGPDLPLTPHSVPEIVRSALKERIPLVIDLFSKELSKADWRRIVQTAIHIIHYENEGGAVHVFLEEAAEFVPQKIYDGETYAEVEKLVRMGGNASVGITLINQRSQEVNKAVLDNCSTALVLGCQVGKNAIEAVEKWIERLDPKTADELTESLPKLQSGEAWVWTRKSLDRPSREKMPMCRSFHPDRRTPEIVLKSARPTDTDEFVARLANNIPKVIEEAKANDPVLLKRRIAELERQAKSPTKAVAKVETKIKHEAALTDTERKRLTALIESHERMEGVCIRMVTMADDIKSSANANRAEMTFFKLLLSEKLSPQPSLGAPRVAPGSVPARERVPVVSRTAAPDSNGKLPHGEEKVLSACIQFQGGLQREQITVLTGFKRSTRDAYIYRLVTKGLVRQIVDTVIATPDGIAALPNYEPLPTGEELQDYWKQRLPQGECALFEHILAAYPNTVSREQLTELTGFKRSTRDAYLYRMSNKMLFSNTDRGEVRASDNLFQ